MGREVTSMRCIGEEVTSMRFMGGEMISMRCGWRVDFNEMRLER